MIKNLVFLVALATFVSALPVVTATSDHDLVKVGMEGGYTHGLMDMYKILVTNIPMLAAGYNTMVDNENPIIDQWNAAIETRFPDNYQDLLVPDYQKV